MAHYTEFYVTVTVDEFAGEWDGDEPLDDSKTWTPYTLFLYGRPPECASCGHREDELLDSLGGVWASDDMDGRDYIEECIRSLDTQDGQPLPDIDDLNVRYI